jgi:hypothetical protein
VVGDVVHRGDVKLRSTRTTCKYHHWNIHVKQSNTPQPLPRSLAQPRKIGSAKLPNRTSQLWGFSKASIQAGIHTVSSAHRRSPGCTACAGSPGGILGRPVLSFRLCNYRSCEARKRMFMASRRVIVYVGSVSIHENEAILTSRRMRYTAAPCSQRAAPPNRFLTATHLSVDPGSRWLAARALHCD